MTASVFTVTRAVSLVKDMAGLDIPSPDESIVYGRVRIRILCKLLQKYRTTGSQPDDQIVKRYFTEFATYLGSQNAKAPLQLGRVKDIADRETSDNEHQEDDAGRNHKRSYLQNFLNLDDRQRESIRRCPSSLSSSLPGRLQQNPIEPQPSWVD